MGVQGVHYVRNPVAGFLLMNLPINDPTSEGCIENNNDDLRTLHTNFQKECLRILHIDPCWWRLEHCAGTQPPSSIERMPHHHGQGHANGHYLLHDDVAAMRLSLDPGNWVGWVTLHFSP